MLRKRSRSVTSSKQTLVSDHNSSSSNLSSVYSEKSSKPTSFLFNPPKFFNNFFISNDYSSQNSTIMSPSSVLDTKPLFSSIFPNCPPLWYDNKTQNPQHSWEKPGIGLALIDNDNWDIEMGAINNTMNKASKERSKLVVFGSQLKIHIPPTPNLLPLQFPSNSPQSPMEFGIKTPKSNFLGHVFVNDFQKEEDYSIEDMESSEDYTCVISHGPNPKTTHIFGNCIVESPCGSISNTSTSTSNRDSHESGDLGFLSFCHHCNKKIGQGKDIFIYRGERAFCSEECRRQEMLFDGIES